MHRIALHAIQPCTALRRTLLQDSAAVQYATSTIRLVNYARTATIPAQHAPIYLSVHPAIPVPTESAIPTPCCVTAMWDTTTMGLNNSAAPASILVQPAHLVLQHAYHAIVRTTEQLMGVITVHAMLATMITR